MEFYIPAHFHDLGVKLYVFRVADIENDEIKVEKPKLIVLIGNFN